MNRDVEHLHISDLSSGHFYKTIPFKSNEEITQIKNEAHVRFFLGLIYQKYSKIECFVSFPGSDVKEVQKVNILKKENEFFLDSFEDIPSEVLSFYFYEGTKTYYFASKLGTDGALTDLHYLVQVHRRFSKRYNIKHLSLDAKIQTLDQSIDAKIEDISLNGIKLSSLLIETPELFETIELSVNCSGSEHNFKATVVHINEQNKNSQIGLKIDSDIIEFKSQYYFNLIDKFGLGATKLDAAVDEKTLIDAFSSAVNPQPLDPHILKADKNAATFMIYEKDGTLSSGISQYCVNDRLALLHTLVLSPIHIQRLPLELYEYAANYILSQGDIKFFSGYWPSKNKLLDRAYTNFVKQDYDDHQHYFKQISIYKVKTNALPPKNKHYQTRPYENSFYQEVHDILKKNVNDVFLEAFGLREELKTPTNNLRVLFYKEHLVGVSFHKKAISKINVYGLIDQCWMFFKDTEPPLEHIQCFCVGNVDFFKAEQSVCLQGSHKDLAKNDWVSESIVDLNFWIASVKRARRFLSHLEQINFEIEFISRNKNKLSNEQLRFFRSYKNPFFRRNSLRVSGDQIVKDIQVTLRSGAFSLIANRVLSIDTFGVGLQLPSNIVLDGGLPVELVIEIDGVSFYNIKAEVKYCHSNMSSGFSNLYNVAGLRFLELEGQPMEAIKSYCFRYLNAELSNLSANEYEKLTDLLTKSKYFEYYNSTKKDHFISESAYAYKSLDKLVPNLARVTILKDENDQVIGTQAFYKRARKTWQLHQLAIDETRALYKSKIPTKTVLKGSFEYLCLDPSVNYFVTYFHDDAAIGKTYFDVANHHDDLSDFEYVPFTGYLYEDLSEREPPIFLKGFEISKASDKDIKVIRKHLQTSLSKVEYDALDYADLRQVEFNRDWNEKGFERTREVFVLKHNNNILHFSVCDVSPRGINLIGLVDIFRLFNITWESAFNKYETLKMLCDYVASYYCSLGRTQVYLEMDPELGNLFQPNNARSLGKNWRLVASRNTFMTTLQYFNARFERLEKRLLRKKNEG